MAKASLEEVVTLFDPGSEPAWLRAFNKVKDKLKPSDVRKFCQIADATLEMMVSELEATIQTRNWKLAKYQVDEIYNLDRFLKTICSGI